MGWWDCQKGAEMGLQGCDASLPLYVGAMWSLSMMGDARPDVAHQSMAMLLSCLDSPSVGF